MLRLLRQRKGYKEVRSCCRCRVIHEEIQDVEYDDVDEQEIIIDSMGEDAETLH